MGIEPIYHTWGVEKMVKMYFEFMDEEEELQNMVMDDMLEIANRYGISFVLSYKDYKINKK